jgi:hypothetical protein
VKLTENHLAKTSVRAISSLALIATLIFAPSLALAVDKDVHEDRTELRIKYIHQKLKITPEQETLWSKVAQVMVDEAKTMDTLSQTRFEHAKSMTAVDDLKSYGEIADAHANGLKKLIPAFSELYVGLSDTQKKEADILFREGVSKHKPKKGQK